MKSISLIATLLFAAGSAFAQAGLPVTHEFVVRVESAHDLHDVLEDFNLILIDSYPSRGLYLVAPNPVDPGRGDDEVEHQLEGDGRLLLHEKNRQNYAEDGHTQSFFVGVAPSDFASQPTFDRIGLNQSPPGWVGQGVTIAILDTGVAPHSEFWFALREDGGNFINTLSPLSDTPTGIDSNHNGVFDELAGHGTFVAGLISHVAPGAQILPVRVLDSDGLGTSFSVAAGIYYAIDHGARVINLSLSSPFDSLTVSEAVDAARAANVAIVASVANNGASIPQYPAAYTGVIAVAATDLTDRRLPTSDFAGYVKFSAPGADVISTFPGEEYASASGTSVSTALVTGGLARTISRMPNAPVSFSAKVLYDNAVPIDRWNWPYRGTVGKRLLVGKTVLKVGPSTFTVETP